MISCWFILFFPNTLLWLEILDCHCELKLPACLPLYPQSVTICLPLSSGHKHTCYLFFLSLLLAVPPSLSHLAHFHPYLAVIRNDHFFPQQDTKESVDKRSGCKTCLKKQKAIFNHIKSYTSQRDFLILNAALHLLSFCLFQKVNHVVVFLSRDLPSNDSQQPETSKHNTIQPQPQGLQSAQSVWSVWCLWDRKRQK